MTNLRPPLLSSLHVTKRAPESFDDFLNEDDDEDSELPSSTDMSSLGGGMGSKVSPPEECIHAAHV